MVILLLVLSYQDHKPLFSEARGPVCSSRFDGKIKGLCGEHCLAGPLPRFSFLPVRIPGRKKCLLNNNSNNSNNSIIHHHEVFVRMLGSNWIPPSLTSSFSPSSSTGTCPK